MKTRPSGPADSRQGDREARHHHRRRRKIQWLNRCASAAYSPATNVKGEDRGEQGAEAVEPRGQEAQAKKEGSRETNCHQAANGKNLRILGAPGRRRAASSLPLLASA